MGGSIQKTQTVRAEETRTFLFSRVRPSYNYLHMSNELLFQCSVQDYPHLLSKDYPNLLLTVHVHSFSFFSSILRQAWA